MQKTLAGLATVAILTFAGGYLTTDGMFAALIPVMRNAFGTSATIGIFLLLYRFVNDDVISEKWPFAAIAAVMFGCFIASHAGWVYLVPTWFAKLWVQIVLGGPCFALVVFMLWPSPRRA